jgi:DNA-binding NtrC family response regulator
VISFEMPPLREHKEDIPLLADHFLHRFAQETNKPVDQISREALDEMMLYDWPGNVRELGNAMERAVVVGRGRRIVPEDLPIFRPEHVSPARGRTLREVETNHLNSVLNETQWNISKSAEILGIDRSTLYDKIKRYELRKPA